MKTSSDHPITALSDIRPSSTKRAMVRQLTANDRDRLVQHFESLDDDDRLLRFGQHTNNHVIENYVRGIDFTNDVVFGVFDNTLRLVGVGHLAYMPPQEDEDGRTAEFGLSVLESARGTGVGSALFKRAAIRSRNSKVTTLYMHCLAHNATMMHIAKKAGMDIRRDYGEADAYLALPPADSSTILGEMLEEQAAVFDYALKKQIRQADQLIRSFLPVA